MSLRKLAAVSAADMKGELAAVDDETYRVYLWEEALTEASRVPAAHRQCSDVEAMRGLSEEYYRALVPAELRSSVPAPMLDWSSDAEMLRAQISVYDVVDHRIILADSTPRTIAHETAHAAVAALYLFGLDENPVGHGPAFCGALAHLMELQGWQPRETIERMARDVCGVEMTPWQDIMSGMGC